MRWWLSLIILFGVTSLGLTNPEPRKRSFKGSKPIIPALDEESEGSAEGAKEGSNNRDGKLFSLFNIVQFKNSGCRSQSTLSSSGTGSTNRNGTCYTTQECSSKGGTASGNCAAGFGVCCVFLVSNSGTTIQQNCTYIRNPGFPSTYTGGTNGVSYTIKKCGNSICQLRLDFESFTIKGTGNTLETLGGVCLDTFTVTTNTNQGIPTICGQNTGQHIYVDIGNMASDTATLNFAFSGTSSTRQWEIKVTQIPCYGACSKAYQAPPGCLQYQTGLTGRLTTFNFIPTTDNHLASQDYSICIRQEKGYCCIQYTPCTDTNSFSLDTQGLAAGAGAAMIDSSCTLDYIEIPASSGTCNQGSQFTPVVNKYCGQFFNAFSKSTVNSVVCDCTQPFMVNIHTDKLPDLAAGNLAKSRGDCLTWMQIPCNS